MSSNTDRTARPICRTLLLRTLLIPQNRIFPSVDDLCDFSSLSTLFIAIISNLSLLSWLALPSPESCPLLRFLPNLLYINSNSHRYERPCCHMEPSEYCSNSVVWTWASQCLSCVLSWLLTTKVPLQIHWILLIRFLPLDWIRLKLWGVNDLVTGNVSDFVWIPFVLH